MNRLGEVGWYNLVRSKGSRGPWDVRGRTSEGHKAYIQKLKMSQNGANREDKKS